VKGSGMLQPGKKVKVGGDVYEAKKAVVIATGSRVKGIPQIGLEINKTTVISSDEALLMEKVPASLAIVGAGAVGMEFADIFSAFGVKITLIEALPRILPLEDAEASDALAKSYKKRGIEVIAGAKVTKATVAKDKVTLDVEAGGEKKSVAVEAVLMAAGRAVNTENVGLAECGIQVTERGFIKVDKNLQTTAPGYYAIGDVAGPPMLAHKGSREGVFVAELLAGQKPHANAVHGLSLEEEDHPNPKEWVQSLLAFAGERNVKLVWCNCGMCVDERGVENQVEGVCRGSPVDAWKYSESSDGVLLIGTE